MADFTKKAIKESFLKLLNEKPLAKITVRDIVEDCGINRNSFYYHYQDVPALLEEIITDEAGRLFDEYPAIESMEQALEVALQFALNNKTAVLHIFNSLNRDSFEAYMMGILDKTVTSYVNIVFEGFDIAEEDKQLIIKFGKCECIGIVLEWLKEGMKEDIIENSRRIFAMNRMIMENGGFEGMKKKLNKKSE